MRIKFDNLFQDKASNRLFPLIPPLSLQLKVIFFQRNSSTKSSDIIFFWSHSFYASDIVPGRFLRNYLFLLQLS
ncbi:hypothetical protein SAMN05443144_11622 [Fodinibius roseus]|uniref:Uncharacterized protein n=1 Tax=Fodinibius roseus TaxID=1194090 RepID=A0A1M5FZI0_9BACT|nr:hypothetical protein SAMN05443144_11622 [Fodinibius roseus]